jgi:hypothetical protein
MPARRGDVALSQLPANDIDADERSTGEIRTTVDAMV